MLKKLIAIAFILTFAGQTSVFAELTPLQKKARAAYAKLTNNEQVEAVCADTSDEEEKQETSIEAVPVEHETSEAPVEDNEPKLDNCEETPTDYEPKTASEASSKDRTAKINKKWSVEALGWNTELSGHVAVADNEDALAIAINRGNAKIDLKNDTSLDKKKVPGLKLSYRNGGRSSFEFNWVNIEQNGHLNGDVKEFKGKQYAGDADFEIKNAMFDLVWKYRFNHKLEESGREKSYVAGLFGVKASKMKFTFDGQAGELDENGNIIGALAQTHEDESETVPVPYIGVEAGTYIGEKLYLKGHIRYLKLNNIKKYDAEHSDYDISLSYKLSSSDGDQDIFFDVGYRQVVYDVEGEGKDVELKYKGPYFGLVFLF
jgi:hypothetical protein